MTTAEEWKTFASRTLAQTSPDEMDVRRAVSALYYGLFHRLANEGAALFSSSGPATVAQVARTYSHTLMRRVCQAYGGSGPLPKPLDSLVATPIDPALTFVARTFTRLQQVRHSADYDLTATVSLSFTPQYGRRLLLDYEHAHRQWDSIRHQPEAATFLTALLLHDKWSTRG